MRMKDTGSPILNCVEAGRLAGMCSIHCRLESHWSSSCIFPLSLGKPQQALGGCLDLHQWNDCCKSAPFLDWQDSLHRPSTLLTGADVPHVLFAAVLGQCKWHEVSPRVCWDWAHSLFVKLFWCVAVIENGKMVKDSLSLLLVPFAWLTFPSGFFKGV